MIKETMRLKEKKASRISVCYFGTYEKNYPRNRIMIKGLEVNQVKVIECHTPLWEKTEDKTGKFAKSKSKIIFNILKSYLKLIKKYSKIKKPKTLIVGYLGQADMILAKLIAPRKKIIFNPMISLYDTMVLDRRMYKKGSLLAKLILWLDRFSCKLANLVILDTPEHARYFENKIKVPRKKLRVVPVGADDNIFKLLNPQDKKGIKILFYGKFTPIHGIEYIIEAAKKLEKHKDLKITIIGKGQTHNKVMRLYEKIKPNNIEFIDWVPYEELPKIINDSDICLGGHFGLGDKAGRVIPNKTFQMMALKKPVIVSESIASKEGGLVHKENSFFCKRGSTKEIINAIEELINNKSLRSKISKGAYDLFKEKYSIDAIGKRTLNILKNGKN